MPRRAKKMKPKKKSNRGPSKSQLAKFAQAIAKLRGEEE